MMKKIKKIKKIKIKVNGKFKSIYDNYKISDLVKDLKIPLKKDDKIEIVHFIGGG